MKRLHLALSLVSLILASSALADSWKPAPGPLMTKWAKDVNPAAPLPEYPRPQLVRKDWLNLNGLWNYSLTDSSITTPGKYDGQILVPFPYESALSGVGKPCVPDQRIWCQRKFTVPAEWNKSGKSSPTEPSGSQRIMLHFGAVNYHTLVRVNGQLIGDHKGGYDEFSFDITEHLKPGENDLEVGAWNPVAAGVNDAQVLGKQRIKPGGIFYTAASGIWQTVWLEPVPELVGVQSLKITPNVDAGEVEILVFTPKIGVSLVEVYDGETKIGGFNEQSIPLALAEKIGSDRKHTVAIPNAKLWTPETPHLYTIKVKTTVGPWTDIVTSYFAMRKISLGKDEQGQNRILLNNKFVFQRGVLDQGYWPDGLYTAPTDEALRYDLEVTKQLGFNMSRKHAKVEPERWYYWADKLGVLVWQDMPQMFGHGKDGTLSDSAKQQFETEWREEIAQFYNHPSIVVWTTFNEGWGQHATPEVVALTRKLDPTRLVNNASGWTDQNVGDIHDTHAYPTPKCELPSATRASVCGEFGGLGMRVDGHMWSKGAWGYQGVYATAYPLTKKYQALQKEAWKLSAERGMSAFVYTQLTDVEEESNGLLTYDRAIIKPDIATTTAANEGKFLPLPPDPNPFILATSMDEPMLWSYSFDQPAADWFKPEFTAKGWLSGPGVFGNEVGNVGTPWKSPDIYLLREFLLPETIPAKLTLHVLHDENAEIYLNGVLAAKVEKFVGTYVPLPVSDEAMRALKPGKNSIAVHCHQTIGGQSIDMGISETK